MNILHLVDLDGTANTIDIKAALEGRGCPEIHHYILAAADFVAKETDLPKKTVFDGLKTSILTQVYPQRDQYQYWGSFPSTTDEPVKIVPAVDHFMLVIAAVPLVLKDELVKAGQNTPTGNKIKTFLESKWVHPLFKFSSDASLPHAEIEEDAREALEDILSRDELVAILTNSSPEKARILLERAGFGDRIQAGGVDSGKIGAIGNTRKFQVDLTQPTEGAFLDLSPYFGFQVHLDLRRRVFRGLVRKLVEETRVQAIRVYSDMPEMDIFPLAAEFGTQARHGMKLNPCSVEGSIRAARALIGTVTENSLSALVKQMRG